MARVPIINGRLTAISGRTVAMPKLGAAHTRNSQHRDWAAKVKLRAWYTCERCGRHETRMFADHIKEVIDGGDALDLSNGQCLCGACHTIKTNNERIKRVQQSVRG